MPSGVYIRTKEYCKLMSRVMTPVMRNPEVRAKISKSSTGIVRAPFKGERIGWLKGIPWTPARRKAYLVGIAKREKSNPNKRKSSRTYKSRGNVYTENWDTLRKEIYERDMWRCQECGVHCGTTPGKFKIQCHHINYDIKNNDKSNLITLCASCHCKTNFARKDWTTYFYTKHNIEIKTVCGDTVS